MQARIRWGGGGGGGTGVQTSPFVPAFLIFFYSLLVVREVGDVRGYHYPADGKIAIYFKEGAILKHPLRDNPT